MSDNKGLMNQAVIDQAEGLVDAMKIGDVDHGWSLLARSTDGAIDIYMKHDEHGKDSTRIATAVPPNEAGTIVSLRTLVPALLGALKAEMARTATLTDAVNERTQERNVARERLERVSERHEESSDELDTLRAVVAQINEHADFLGSISTPENGLGGHAHKIHELLAPVARLQAERRMHATMPGPVGQIVTF